ncbi:MAG: hypothetical protein KJ955_05705 [Nanoarchaeota archaeon]|nr:hypothetical protein [Nanoarchaeota archaeon]
MNGKYLTELVEKCMEFVKSNGRILENQSNMFFDSAKREFRGDVRISCYALQSPHSEGFFRIEVRDGRTLVLYAKGDYPGKITNVDVEFYKPGDWEKKITL